jgi:hypothetical protein
MNWLFEMYHEAPCSVKLDIWITIRNPLCMLARLQAVRIFLGRILRTVSTGCGTWEHGLRDGIKTASCVSGTEPKHTRDDRKSVYLCSVAISPGSPASCSTWDSRVGHISFGCLLPYHYPLTIHDHTGLACPSTTSMYTSYQQVAMNCISESSVLSNEKFPVFIWHKQQSIFWFQIFLWEVRVWAPPPLRKSYLVRDTRLAPTHEPCVALPSIIASWGLALLS